MLLATAVASSSPAEPTAVVCLGPHIAAQIGRGIEAGESDGPLVSYQLTHDISGEELEPTTRSYGNIGVASKA